MPPRARTAGRDPPYCDPRTAPKSTLADGASRPCLCRPFHRGGLEACKEASQVTLRGSFSAIGISLWDDTYGRKPLRRSQHSSAYRVPSFQKILETQRRRWTREALVRKAITPETALAFQGLPRGSCAISS